MSDEGNPDSGKAPHPADDSGPDSAGAGGDTLGALMREADALAQELGDQVGAPSPKADAKQDASAGTPPTPDPEAHVEHVQKNLDRAATEIGTEPSDQRTPLEVPPPAPPAESAMDGLDPSEWQTDCGDVPTIEGGDEAEPASAAPPLKKTRHAGKANQASQDGRPRPTPDKEDKPSPSSGEVQSTGAPKRRRLGGLRARFNMARRAAISPKDLLRSVRRLPEAAGGRPLVAFRSMLATIDRPFGWVPLVARPFIGYVAVLTLVSSLVTFAVGWFR